MQELTYEFKVGIVKYGTDRHSLIGSMLAY